MCCRLRRDGLQAGERGTGCPASACTVESDTARLLQHAADRRHRLVTQKGALSSPTPSCFCTARHLDRELSKQQACQDIGIRSCVLDVTSTMELQERGNRLMFFSFYRIKMARGSFSLHLA